MRVELRKSDPEAQYGNKRAELTYNNFNSSSQINTNVRWYAWSNYFPSATCQVDPAEEIFSQWHDKSSSCSSSPPLAFEMKNGRYRIVIRYATSNYCNGGNITTQYFDLGPIGYDQWNDWVVNYNPQYNSTGYVKIWLNGKVVLDYKGACHYNGSLFPYWKLGIYKWLWMGSGSSSKTTQRVYYVDDVKTGDTKATESTFVKGGSTTPPAATNTPPTANAGSDLFITLPTSSVTLNGKNSSDANGSIATYKWSQVSGPGTATFSAASSSSTTASKLVAGTYVFRLTVTDNEGSTDTDDITVSVANGSSTTNKVPTASAGSAKTITLPTSSATLSGSGSDPDGSIKSYKWAQVSGPGTATFSTTTAASTTVSKLVAGTYSFRLTVTDNSGATAASTVSVTVNAATSTGNKAPVADAGAPKAITLPTSSTQLSSKSYDPDGSISKYLWTQVSGPNTATFNNTGSSMPTVSKLVAGVYTFKLTITDNKGATASATTTVTVNAAATSTANKAPIAKTVGQQSLVGTSVTLNGEDSYDPDGQITTYKWTQSSGPSTATLSNASSANAQASNLKSGTYVFELQVTDNKGATAKASLTLKVTATSTSTAPVARAGGDQTITLPTSSVTLDGSASSDPTGAIKTYAWTRISGSSSATIATASQARTQVSNLTEGTYRFRLQVTGSNGQKDADTLVVTVMKASGSNQAPVAKAGDDKTIEMPINWITLDASWSYDNDGKITLYQWKMVSGNSSAKIENANTATTKVTNLQPGVYVFQLTIKDDKGAIATDELRTTVVGTNGSTGASNLTTYPNPVSTTMNIRLEDNVTGTATARIYNMLGVVMLQETINKNSGTYTKQYNLSSFPAGTYIYSIEFPKQERIVKKFQKL